MSLKLAEEGRIDGDGEERLQIAICYFIVYVHTAQCTNTCIGLEASKYKEVISLLSECVLGVRNIA